MKEFLETQLPAIITGILGVGAYVFERRRKNAEIQHVESDATQAMQAGYKNWVNDANNKFEEMRSDILSMKTKISHLEENEQLMTLKIEGLEKEVVEWKQKYTSLKKEMELRDNGINTTPNDGKI